MMEKHIQTIIASIILAITLWMGKTIAETQTAVAVLTTQLTSTTVEIRDIKDQLKRASVEQFRIKDWADAKSSIDAEDKLLHKRIDSLDSQMRIVMQHIVRDNDGEALNDLQQLRNK